MPFNGSGTFLRVMNWTNDAIAGIRIRADRHDDEDNNLAQGLSQCITKDGQTTITANLPMANYRHTNVGEATAATQYARYDQVQLGKAVWASAGGTADAITATYSPNTIAPVDGQLYYVRAAFANATTTPTFSPDGTTAQVIVKNGNQALSVGDIAGAGHELILRYRLSDTKYELLNPAFSGAATLTGNNTFSGNNTFTGKFLFPDDGELTISSGAITVTGANHTVDTEGDASTDDLDTINGGSDGQELILTIENSARNVVITDAGNISLPSGIDIVLDDTDEVVRFIYSAALSKWVVLSIPASNKIGQSVQLEDVGGSPGLPAVDGSQLTDMLYIGVGQTWQDVTASRAGDTVYTNSTGKPIMVVVSMFDGVSNPVMLVNGVTVAQGSNTRTPHTVIVPNGSTYEATRIAGGSVTIDRWAELR